MSYSFQPGSLYRIIKERWVGEGAVRFQSATWDDLPTLYNIVKTLGELEIKKYVGASVMNTVRAKDLSDQRILG